MSEFVFERSNLPAWKDARTGGTSTVSPSYVAPPTAAALEILNDPHWAEKIRRALADSDGGRKRSLGEFRESL